MSADTPAEGGRVTNRRPFCDLGDFVAIPRVGALRLSPDGSWLAATVQTLSPDRKKYLTSIWRIDTQGGPARRLTRSAEGEGSPRSCRTARCCSPPSGPIPARARRGRTARGGRELAVAAPVRRGEARVVAAPARRRRGRGGGRRAAEPSSSPRRCCRPPTADSTRRGRRPAAPGARATPGLPPSCTSRRRSGSGTTTSGRTSSGCSPSIRIRSRRPGGPSGTKRRSPRCPEEQRCPEGSGARRSGGAVPRAARPDPGTGPGAGRGGVRADARRHVGRHRLVAVGPGRGVAQRAGDDRPGQRQAAGAAQPCPSSTSASPRVSPDGRFIACLRETARHRRAGPTDITLVVLGVDGSGAVGGVGS